nr:hypothetical protein CFP56_39468 [Quercus suber]
MGNHLGACANLSLPKKLGKSSKPKVEQESHQCMATEKVQENIKEAEISIDNGTEPEKPMAANESVTICPSQEPLINMDEVQNTSKCATTDEEVKAVEAAEHPVVTIEGR